MKKLIKDRFTFRRNMIAIIGLCLSFYFCYHLIAGQRGYFSLISLESQIETVSAEHEALKTERIGVEKHVIMMRPGSIDRDLLEERARHILGYRHKDELILLHNRS